MGISYAAFYNWKAKYGGLEVSEAQRLKQRVSVSDSINIDLVLDGNAWGAMIGPNHQSSGQRTG